MLYEFQKKEEKQMHDEIKENRKFARYVPPKDVYEAPVGKCMYTAALVKKKPKSTSKDVGRL
jgi:hypothetical protein